MQEGISTISGHFYTVITIKGCSYQNGVTVQTERQQVHTIMCSQKNSSSVHTFTPLVACPLSLDPSQVIADVVFTQGQQIRSTIAL